MRLSEKWEVRIAIVVASIICISTVYNLVDWINIW